MNHSNPTKVVTISTMMHCLPHGSFKGKESQLTAMIDRLRNGSETELIIPYKVMDSDPITYIGGGEEVKMVILSATYFLNDSRTTISVFSLNIS